MSKAIFICDVPIDHQEGIFKKVYEQARVISKIIGECVFFSQTRQKCSSIKFLDGIEKKVIDIESFYDRVFYELNGGDVIYIRHKFPSLKMLSLLIRAKKSCSKLFYEIPTYPYFGEQIKVSPHKFRTAIRILIDILAWPLIYYCVDSLIVIRSNTRARIYKKMHLIPNGIAVSNIFPFQIMEHPGEINLIVVGTLYSYHGIDRLVNSLKKYYANEKKDKISLHIVGSSREIDLIKQNVKKERVPNIFFYGKMNSIELSNFYSKMDIGVGCLALYRRNADVDTTLKAVEYLCYGLPVVTSGSLMLEDDEIKKMMISVSNDSENISLESIVRQYKRIGIKDRFMAQNLALAELTWDGIFKRILKS